MEKPHSSLKDKILKFIPRAASATVSFKSPPISPRKAPSGLSGRPTRGSIIPRDARRRLKNGSFDAREPGSPIVSCVGQVRKKKATTTTAMIPRAPLPKAPDRLKEAKAKTKTKKETPMMILKLFKGKNKLQGEKSSRDSNAVRGGGENEKPAPSLGHLKQFTSGRGVLANFDWMAQCGTAVAPVNFIENGPCCDHEEETTRTKEREVKKKMTLPHFAPTEARSRIDGEDFALEPRSEINLWKRRTVVCPPTLRL